MNVPLLGFTGLEAMLWFLSAGLVLVERGGRAVVIQFVTEFTRMLLSVACGNRQFCVQYQ